jgi:hypothetical protein
VEIYVSKNNQTYGPYDFVQLKEYVSSGSFLATDLACPVGSSEWHTVGQVLQMHEAIPSHLPPPPPVLEQQNRRHGCLTAYLIFGLVANLLTAISNLILSFGNSWAKIEFPLWVFPVMVILGFFNMVCHIALFKWQKWAFWGFVASCCLAIPVNLMAGTGPSAVLGLIGIAFLYGVLQIGKSNKGWPQLR